MSTDLETLVLYYYAAWQNPQVAAAFSPKLTSLQTTWLAIWGSRGRVSLKICACIPHFFQKGREIRIWSTKNKLISLGH